MKTPVTDVAVDDYVARIRAGGPLGKVFPCKLSDCELTPAQREKIRQARADKRAALKNSKPVVSAPKPPTSSKSAPQKLNSPKALSKLRRILYLQAGNCFFCGRPLAEVDASVEHLNPKSRGGIPAQDNEVVCHKSLNHAFGDMDLKRKFEFILKAKGNFRCPGT